MNDSNKLAERSHTLVLGIGNEYRGDDAVGLIVARRLKARAHDHVSILEHSGEGAALMESWRSSACAILIDAVHSEQKAGTIFRFAAHQQAIPTQFFHYSSHVFGLAEAIELARELKQLPPRLIVYGIEGKNFAAGIGLSAEVEKVVPAVVESVWQEIVCEIENFSPAP
jgi:hydrogenase maturation protease